MRRQYMNIARFAPSYKPRVQHVPARRARCTHAATSAEPARAEHPDVQPWEDVPGPKPLPLLGNTWRFIPYIGGYSVARIDRVCVSLRARYGRCVRLAGLIGRPDMLFVFDADEVERVFRAEDSLPHRPSMPSLDYYKHVLRKDFFGAEENCAGVIAVHGLSWASFRSRVSRVLLAAGAARDYAGPVEDAAEALVRRTREIRNSKLEMPDDYLNELHKWSLESLALVALDARLGCLDAGGGARDTQRLIDAVNTFFLCVAELELSAPFWRLYPTPMFKRFIAALDTIVSVTGAHVSASLARATAGAADGGGGGGSSLLQRLLLAAGPRTATVAALDMFLVGIDTTSNAVASILYQLARHPAAQARLHEEINASLPTSRHRLEPGMLDSMHYLKASIKETLRMYPVVIGNGRQLTRDTIICGYNIPKGTQVIFQHYAMSNSDQYFTNSSTFMPERWLRAGRSAVQEERDEVESSTCPAARHHAFASLPFGYGKRMCLGRRFADLEIQTVICKMIQSFKVEYHHEELDYHIHPMYTPDGPLRLRMIERDT